MKFKVREKKEATCTESYRRRSIRTNIAVESEKGTERRIARPGCCIMGCSWDSRKCDWGTRRRRDALLYGSTRGFRCHVKASRRGWGSEGSTGVFSWKLCKFQATAGTRQPCPPNKARTPDTRWCTRRIGIDGKIEALAAFLTKRADVCTHGRASGCCWNPEAGVPKRRLLYSRLPLFFHQPLITTPVNNNNLFISLLSLPVISPNLTVPS